MRIVRWVWAILLALPSGPAAAQVLIDTPGTVPHRSANALFLERVGEFQRSNVRQYDDAGEDLSASYWLARDDDRLLITVYVYPAARITWEGSPEDRCEAEFREAGAAIAGNNRTARLVAEGSVPTVQDVDPALAHRALYRMEAEFVGRRQPVRSEAYRSVPKPICTASSSAIGW